METIRRINWRKIHVTPWRNEKYSWNRNLWQCTDCPPLVYPLLQDTRVFQELLNPWCRMGEHCAPWGLLFHDDPLIQTTQHVPSQQQLIYDIQHISSRHCDKFIDFSFTFKSMQWYDSLHLVLLLTCAVPLLLLLHYTPEICPDFNYSQKQ